MLDDYSDNNFSLLFWTFWNRVDLFSWALFSSKKFYKIFQILRHIKSLDACMEY